MNGRNLNIAARGPLPRRADGLCNYPGDPGPKCRGEALCVEQPETGRIGADSIDERRGAGPPAALRDSAWGIVRDVQLQPHMLDNVTAWACGHRWKSTLRWRGHDELLQLFAASARWRAISRHRRDVPVTASARWRGSRRSTHISQGDKTRRGVGRPEFDLRRRAPRPYLSNSTLSS